MPRRYKLPKIKEQKIQLAGPGKIWQEKLGYVAVGGLLLLGLGMLCPPTLGQSAQAEEISADLVAKTTVNLASMISVALSSSVEIDIVPKSTGAIGVGVADLKVATNNTTGYSVYLSTVDQTNSLNPMSGQQYDGDTTKYAIKALSNTVTMQDYLNDKANMNTWGYALTKESANAQTTYKGVQNVGGDVIYSTRGTTSNDSYKLNIAVAVDASLPAGGYRNGIVVSAVANPIEVRGFQKIYYMQEMTASICESASEHETGQLVDIRDNEIYFVAKLKDGKCWMTQNLALNLDKNVTLTPENTNITTDWTPTYSTNEVPVEGVAIANNGNLYSWSWGKTVLGYPRQSVSCGKYGKSLSAKTSDNLGETCNYFVDVSRDGWVPGFEATGSTYQTYTAVNQATKTYDAHYLVGNYYQYSAATAGVAVASGANASSSICPKGWRLPTSEINTTTRLPLTQNEYYKLLLAYGYPEANDYAADTYGTRYTPLVGTEKQNPAMLLMGFVRSGNVLPSTGYLYDAGLDARTRGATLAGAGKAVGFLFNHANIFTATIDDSSRGIPVRCIAE